MQAPMNNVAAPRLCATNSPGVCSSHGVINTASRNSAAMPEKPRLAALVRKCPHEGQANDEHVNPAPSWAMT